MGIEVLYKGVVETSLQKARIKEEREEGAGRPPARRACSRLREKLALIDLTGSPSPIREIGRSKQVEARHCVIWSDCRLRRRAPQCPPRHCRMQKCPRGRHPPPERPQDCCHAPRHARGQHTSVAAGLLHEALHPAGQLARQSRLEASATSDGIAKEVARQISASAS